MTKLENLPVKGCKFRHSFLLRPFQSRLCDSAEVSGALTQYQAPLSMSSFSAPGNLHHKSPFIWSRTLTGHRGDDLVLYVGSMLLPWPRGKSKTNQLQHRVELEFKDDKNKRLADLNRSNVLFLDVTSRKHPHLTRVWKSK